MNKTVLNILGACAIAAILAVGCCASFAFYQVGLAAAAIPNAVRSIQQDTSTIQDALTRSCGDGKPCGTLAEVSKGIVKIGDAIVTTQLAERKATPHVIAAMDEFGTAAKHLSGTADALTETAHSASGALDEGKRTIAAMQPLETSLTRTIDASTTTIQTIDGRIGDKRTDDLLTHLDATAAHVDATTADVQYKAHQILHPDKVKLTGWAVVQAGVTWVHNNLIPPLF